jgi:hypothetical protein
MRWLRQLSGIGVSGCDEARRDVVLGVTRSW